MASLLYTTIVITTIDYAHGPSKKSMVPWMPTNRKQIQCPRATPRVFVCDRFVVLHLTTRCTVAQSPRRFRTLSPHEALLHLFS